jgi:ribosomal-protein-alanine N-acetyltransferase
MSNVSISPPTAADREPFLEAVRRSTALHGLWVSPPSTPEAFNTYLDRVSRGDHAAYFVRLAESGELAGVVNVSNIIREPFSNAFLGFYAFEPHNNRGHMQAGLRLVLDSAFGELGLHRVEANIQPENAASIALVRTCGFRREGF